MLQWLAARQRKHAGQLPSYAEMGCWSAISRLKVSNAVVSAQGLTASPPLELLVKGVQSNGVGVAAISNASAASDASTSIGATAAAAADAWVVQEPRRKELAAAVLASRQALAEALPVWNAVNLSPNHPGRVPPLLAAALVAWTAAHDASNSQGGSLKSRPSINDAQDVAATANEKIYESDLNAEDGYGKARAHREVALRHTREALRVHQVAYGGGVELFQLRYPSSELNELMEYTKELCE